MPDTIAELCQVIESADNQSSLLKKAGLPLRRRLVDALIRREPYTYREVFDHYHLASLGISFTAFYYWARKVRRTAALIEMARSCNPDENPVELLPQVLAQRLLDASLDEDIDLSALNRLAQIYHMTSYVEFARRRVNYQIGSPPNPRDAGASRRSAVMEIPSRTSSGGNPFPRDSAPPPDSSDFAESADDLLALSAPAVNPVPSVLSVPSVPSHSPPPPIRHPQSDIPHALIPLAIMRREIDDPARKRARLDPYILPSLKSPDSNLGAIDESPDSHGPGEFPKVPLIKQDFPDPDPAREALRLRVRAAYGLTERLRVNNWIDPALIAEYDLSPNAPEDQLSEEQLRLRDLRRALIAFGVLKDAAPASGSS